jgi:hypothetical protein
MKTLLLVAVFALFAVPARAQSPDVRWEPWLGCWTLATDNLRDTESPDNSGQRSIRPSTVREGAPRVCVSRVPEGARFVTTVGTQSAIDQTIVADAVSRPVNDDECSGTQHAEWSRNGIRLFSSAEIRCKGDEGLRRVSGLSLIAPNGDWLDVQTVAIGPRETIRVKRYYRADDSPRSTRPTVVASRLTLNEIKEASGKVSSAALEAALVETNAGFDLTKKSVMDLASAGVSPRVIDLLVALSYPEKFAVQPVGRAGGAPIATTYGRDPFLGSFGGPFYYDAYYYGSPYLYEPFGYRGAVIVDGGVIGGAGGGPNAQITGGARVINGQGYTRITPRDSTPATNTQTATTASTSRAVPSDSGSSSSSSSSGSSSSGSSSSSSSSGSSGGGGGGGTVSPSGASSGGSSDSGRTAVPR